VNGNQEDSITVGSCLDVDSVSSNLRIRMWDYGMVTIYMHEVERTSSMDRHHRSSTSNQGSSKLLRTIHGMHEMLTAHVPRVLSHRDTLLMLMISSICIFVVSLTIVIFTAVSLSD